MKRFLLFPFFLIGFCFILLSSQVFSQDYVTIGPEQPSIGNWSSSSPEYWTNVGVPPINGTYDNNSTISVGHNINLAGSFDGNRALTLTVGDPNNEKPVTLFISGDFYVKSTIGIEILANASLIIGDPSNILAYCPGEEGYSASVLSLFEANGNGSRITIQPGGRFELFGDFWVNQKFDIEVKSGGVFIVHGGFVAENQAEVWFTGASATIGCDMEFKNGATITMDVSDLNVGGDLLFNNAANVYLCNSNINVEGEICWGPQPGNGTGVYFHELLNCKSNALEGEPHSFVSPVGGFCDDIVVFFPDDEVAPIELLSFTPEIKADRIELKWTTGTEINNDYFTLERSRDMYGWEVLGFVPGAGNSSVPLSYSFSDLRPLDGLAYYRLKQTDFDGKFEYFGPIAAHYDLGMEGLDFKVMKQYTNWVIAVPNDGIYKVEVYNLMGHRLLSEKIENTLTIPAPEGAVVIRVTDGFARSASRVVM